MTIEDILNIYTTAAIDWESAENWPEDPLKGDFEGRGWDTGDQSGREIFQELISELSGSKTLSEHVPSLYGLEDTLDQPLCLTAQRQGIDCILLKYMTGKTRIVSEILDMRFREESFKNILYPPEYK